MGTAYGEPHRAAIPCSACDVLEVIVEDGEVVSGRLIPQDSLKLVRSACSSRISGRLSPAQRPPTMIGLTRAASNSPATRTLQPSRWPNTKPPEARSVTTHRRRERYSTSK